MDIHCTKCGEPWDNDCLHDEIAHRKAERDPLTGFSSEDYQVAYSTMVAEFRRSGCEALTHMQINPCTPDPSSSRAQASGVLMDLLGDDLDGVASMMDDADYLGMFD